MEFPKATPVKLYSIDGELCRRVPASEGINNAEAFRAAVEIKSGEDKGGFTVCWFVKEPGKTNEDVDVAIDEEGNDILIDQKTKEPIDPLSRAIQGITPSVKAKT